MAKPFYPAVATVERYFGPRRPGTMHLSSNLVAEVARTLLKTDRFRTDRYKETLSRMGRDMLWPW